MRSLIWERRRVPWVPILVALLQLALVTWIPVADAVHHCGDHPVTTSGDSGGGHGDGAGLAPVCFICAAGLGAFASSVPDLTPDICASGTPRFESPPGTVPSVPALSKKKARAPPLA